MNKLNPFVVLLWMLTGLAHAQDDAPAPIVTQPGDRMKWTMEVENGSTSQAPPSSMSGAIPNQNAQGGSWTAVSWDYTKDGKLTKVRVTYSQGTVQEYWRMKDVTMAEDPRRHSIVFQSDGPLPTFPKACDGFYGINQVRPGDDKGKKSYKGTLYHYFSGGKPAVPLHGHASPYGYAGPAGPFGPGADQNPGNYEAWFDLKTGLPKAFSRNGETLIFRFSSEAFGDLQLPPKYQAAWQAAGGT